MATATKTTKGFAASCPFCGADDSLTIDINDLDVCVCGSCDTSFSVQDALKKAKAAMEAWTRIARWVERGREMAGD